MILSRAGGE